MKKIIVKLKENTTEFFKFSGIASSESKDADGDIIKQHGIDLSLVLNGKAIVNLEHDEPSVGFIEHAEIINNELYIEGIVFNTTVKTNQFYKMLQKNDPQNPVTLSIEFVNVERAKNNPSIMNQVVLTGVALIGIRDEPANKDTYAQLLKSIPRADLFVELMRRANDSVEFRQKLLKILNMTK